jgi:hypothetical protein
MVREMSVAELVARIGTNDEPLVADVREPEGCRSSFSLWEAGRQPGWGIASWGNRS